MIETGELRRMRCEDGKVALFQYGSGWQPVTPPRNPKDDERLAMDEIELYVPRLTEAQQTFLRRAIGKAPSEVKPYFFVTLTLELLKGRTEWPLCPWLNRLSRGERCTTSG